MFKEVGEDCDSPLSRGKNEEKKEKEARSMVRYRSICRDGYISSLRNLRIERIEGI